MKEPLQLELEHSMLISSCCCAILDTKLNHHHQTRMHRRWLRVLRQLHKLWVWSINTSLIKEAKFPMEAVPESEQQVRSNLENAFSVCTPLSRARQLTSNLTSVQRSFLGDSVLLAHEEEETAQAVADEQEEAIDARGEQENAAQGSTELDVSYAELHDIVERRDGRVVLGQLQVSSDPARVQVDVEVPGFDDENVDRQEIRQAFEELDPQHQLLISRFARPWAVRHEEVPVLGQIRRLLQEVPA